MRQFYCDDETGEILTYPVNEETGEPVVENLVGQMFVRTRNVPITKPAKFARFPKGHISKSKQFQSLKANIMAGSNTISPRLLLIPTIMFFHNILCVLLMILEIYLHVHCHKKNKTLKDPNMYYRSPFHIITSTFCGVCRDSDAASKVGQLQDQRRHRYDYFRSIAM